MVEGEDGEQGAGVLRRWSRRKQGLADAGKASEADDDEASSNSQIAPVEPASVAPVEATADAAEEEPLLTDEDMPAIDSIGKDSDVSCFFNRGVSEQLRQRALKHLLRLPAFNITDGLNDYDEDYTSFEPLGDIVTSDMRFHAKRKEKLAAQQREEEEALRTQQSEELESAEANIDETELEENAKSADENDTAGEDNAPAEAAENAPSEMMEDAADSHPQPVIAEAVQNQTKPGDLA